jgi:hypothetical protein
MKYISDDVEEFVRVNQTGLLCVCLLLVICWLTSGTAVNNSVSKPSRKIPNEAEIPYNLQVMDEMNVPPRLKEIMICESFGGIQSYTDGTPLLGRENPNDKGIAQINIVHWAEAKELGFDLDTLRGNIRYAIFLFEREGDKPWNSSKVCWQRSATYLAYNR